MRKPCNRRVLTFVYRRTCSVILRPKDTFGKRNTQCGWALFWWITNSAVETLSTFLRPFLCVCQSPLAERRLLGIMMQVVLSFWKLVGWDVLVQVSFGLVYGQFSKFCFCFIVLFKALFLRRIHVPFRNRSYQVGAAFGQIDSIVRGICFISSPVFLNPSALTHVNMPVQSDIITFRQGNMPWSLRLTTVNTGYSTTVLCPLYCTALGVVSNVFDF